MVRRIRVKPTIILTITCGSCGRVHKVSNPSRGRVITCSCGHRVRIT